MDYKEKYEQAFEKAKEVYNREDATNGGKLILESMFPELKESYDEKVRKWLIDWANTVHWSEQFSVTKEQVLAWLENVYTEDDINRAYKCADEVQYRKGYEDAKKELEKQGEHKCDCKYVGCHVNDVKRWCHKKQAEILYEKCNIECSEYLKQGEQKPTDKVEPKSDIEKGKWYVCNTSRYRDFVVGKAYYCPKNGMLKSNENEMARYVARNCFHLWTIQDAKDGDVLYHKGPLTGIEYIVMSRGINGYGNVDSYFRYNSVDGFGINVPSVFNTKKDNIIPATKEQRDILFFKMKEAGYEWDAEKKELKRIESVQPELPNGEDCGIDSLYHAARILEKTLGEVDGYQSDDGILEHKCAIEAVKRLYKQKPAWSEKDERMFKNTIALIETFEDYNKAPDGFGDVKFWLKSLKERYTWKPSDEQMKALLSKLPVIIGCGDAVQDILESLYQDLKKLREE